MRNFCINNICCPWYIKKSILNSCIDSVILYSSETWSKVRPQQAEIMHRQAIRVILGVKDSLNNEIVHYESNISNLEASIRARQWTFWNKIKQQFNLQITPLHQLINFGITSNIQFIKYYEKLIEDHTSKDDCYRFYNNKFWNELKITTNAKAQRDIGAKLHTYLLINPNLTPYITPNIFDVDRHFITKYRTGCHHLAIETGRWTRIPRHERFCICGPVIQNIEHVILYCPLLNDFRQSNITDVYDFFNSETDVILEFLMKAEVVLNLK